MEITTTIFITTILFEVMTGSGFSNFNPNVSAQNQTNNADGKYVRGEITSI